MALDNNMNEQAPATQGGVFNVLALALALACLVCVALAPVFGFPGEGNGGVWGVKKEERREYQICTEYRVLYGVLRTE